jgi:hypothetical protein
MYLRNTGVGGTGDTAWIQSTYGRAIFATGNGSATANPPFAGIQSSGGVGLWGTGYTGNPQRMVGVYGEFGSTTFPTFQINGVGNAGAGVAGVNDGATTGIGVYAKATGSSAQAVQAVGGNVGISATAGTASGYAGYFGSSGASSRGIVVESENIGISVTSKAASSPAYYGQVSTNASVVQVINDGAASNSTGVLGIVKGGLGVGVKGQINNGQVGSIGVYGTNPSVAGYGIQADNTVATVAGGGAALFVNGLIKVATNSASTTGSPGQTVTINQPSGTIAMNNASIQTLTMTNSYVTPKSVVLVSFGTTSGVNVAPIVKVSAGQAVLAWNATQNFVVSDTINFVVINQ